MTRPNTIEAGERTQVSALQRVRQWEQEQADSYAVIIDGNSHRFYRDADGQHQGKQTRPVRTTKELITVSKCKSIVAAVAAEFGISVQRIVIPMTEYDYASVRTEDDAKYVLSGDCPVRETVSKEAVYDVRANCLTIWQHGMPIYQNNNGTISRDRDALADCLC